MKLINGGVCAAKGFKASGIHCGIRKNRTKRELALSVSEVKANAAAVYTTNLVKGAPLTVTKKHIADGHAQAVICNSGNANTCNANGIEIAEQMSNLLAKELGINAEDVKGGAEAIKALYREYYRNGLVRFMDADDEAGFMAANSLSGRDAMHITVEGNEARSLLVARFENLGKGA